jgi:hypothetical protein
MIVNDGLHIRTSPKDFTVYEAFEVWRPGVAVLHVAVQVETHDVAGRDGGGRQASGQQKAVPWRGHPDADMTKAVDDAVPSQYAVGDNQFFDESGVSG